MVNTARKVTASSSSPPPALAEDNLQDALVDSLAEPPRKQQVIEAGPKVNIASANATRGDTKDPDGDGYDADGNRIMETYLPYPKTPNKQVVGTTRHTVELGDYADGSALIANSSEETGTTHDQWSLYDAYARYSEEHPTWSDEQKLVMASREDLNKGGDVVAAGRRDGGGQPKNGRKMAFVIGNSNYKTLKPLSGVPADAAGIAGRWEGMGFSVHRYDDVGAAKMSSVFEKIPQYAKAGDQVNVYFGGHGTHNSGLAGINAAGASDTDLGSWVTDSVDYGAIGILASEAVSNGWHLTGIMDCCESGGVADAVLDQLQVNTKSSRSMDYGIETDEIAEKGLMLDHARYKGPVMNELIWKRMYNHHGYDSKYGAGKKPKS